MRRFFHDPSVEGTGRAAAPLIAVGSRPYACPRQSRAHLARTLHIMLVLHVARDHPSLCFLHPSGRRKASRVIHFESRTRSPAAGGGIGVAAIESGVCARRTSPTAVLEHSLGAVVCKGSSTCWHDYELSEHGGWRGQPLGGAAAGVGGAGGVGGVGSARIGASAPVDSMAAWTRRSTLLAARVRRGAPERCAVMARDERRLAACDVVSLLYCRLVVVVAREKARSGHPVRSDVR